MDAVWKKEDGGNETSSLTSSSRMGFASPFGDLCASSLRFVRECIIVRFGCFLERGFLAGAPLLCTRFYERPFSNDR